MCSLRDILIFLSGAAALHTLSHIWLGESGLLPMNFCLELTPHFNMIVTGISALITIALLWWASKQTK